MSAADLHFAANDLADYAFSPRPQAPEFDGIREHLADGCPVCAMQVAIFSGGQASYPAEIRRGREWIVPKRVARAGSSRAGGLADYELVCGAGDYELDVIVREIETPQRLDIGGQVTRAMALHDPARDVPLYLVEAKGDDVVSATRTDEFGEFDFAANRGSRYGLRVGDGGDAPCVLVWEGAA